MSNENLGFISGYWSYAFAIALAFYGAISWFGTHHLSTTAKESLTLWLWGEYDETWSKHFCNLFDAVFGSKHLSWQCFIRSALASVLSVSLIYILFSTVLDVLNPSSRAGSDLPIFQALLLGAIINIIPDYLSLFETRWVLKRFDHIKSFSGQLFILVVDAIATGSIIWLAINVFQWITGGSSLSAVEMLALFSIYSLFFYSTFLTSIWAWLFAITTWFMRLFAHTPLKEVLDIETKPVEQIALIGAILIFVFTLLFTPFVTTSNPHKATAFDEMLCNYFPADICVHLGRLTKNEKEQLNYLTKACVGGGVEHCVNTGLKHLDGDEAKAVDLWRKGCDSGIELACSNLGMMHAQGRGNLPKDDNKAIALYRQACQRNNIHGCNNLGIMYQQGRGDLVKDEQTAFYLFTKACLGGSPNACTSLGFIYEFDRSWLLKDEVKAKELYIRACDGGDALGCNNLGYMYARGRGGLYKNNARAVILYEKACKAGNAFGCNNLGYMYANGYGGLNKDEVKAISLYKLACENKLALGCRNLAKWNQKVHSDLVKDETKAAELVP